MNPFGENTPLLTAVLSMAAASLVWWWRERRLARLRERVAAIHALSEEILSRRSAAAMQDLLAAELPAALEGVAPRLWLADRAAGLLEPAGGRGAAAPLKSGGPLVECLKSGAPQREEDGGGLRLLLPMRVEGETTGVLELRWPERRRIPADEEAALAHLGNQAAIALRLIDQSVLREQLLRSERLGAVGQLISGAAAELQEPVEEAARIAARLRQSDPANSDYRALGEWTEAAAQALDRLMAFGRPGEMRARPADLCELIRKLAGFRERTWRLRQVEARLDLPPGPLMVMGSYGQLEQALLSVILRAEELMPEEGLRRLDIAAQAEEGRAQAVIRFRCPQEPENWGLGVAQGIAGNHGGSLSAALEGEWARCCLELPLLEAPAGGEEGGSEGRMLTLLLLAGEDGERRHLMELLAARGHRVAPAASADEALDLCGRFRFDALLAAAPAGDQSWTGLQERAAKLGLTFVLLPASEDPGVHPLVASGAALMLRRPPEPAELARVLAEIARRSGTAGG
jgi:hypothetical protein